MIRLFRKATIAGAAWAVSLTGCGEAGLQSGADWYGSAAGDAVHEDGGFGVDGGDPDPAWPDTDPAWPDTDPAWPDTDAGSQPAPEDAGKEGSSLAPDAQTEPVDSGPDHTALWFNIVLRQTEQACNSCGIWFDWQQEQANKPKLVVEFQHEGTEHTSIYQHGLGGMENAFSMYLSQNGDREKHSMLIKQSLARNAFFRADIGDIPVGATVTKATLHLHIHTHEGLAYADTSSVLAVHACDKMWNWDHATWSHYDQGAPWAQSGGDFGAFIREIRAKEDLVDRGFSKANPDATVDFTPYVAALQATRVP